VRSCEQSLANEVYAVSTFIKAGVTRSLAPPQLRALLDVHDQAFNLVAMHACIWGSHCIKQFDLLAMHACNPALPTNKKKKKKEKKERKMKHEFHASMIPWMTRKRASGKSFFLFCILP
jgi:hypothetical protein